MGKRAAKTAAPCRVWPQSPEKEKDEAEAKKLRGDEVVFVSSVWHHVFCFANLKFLSGQKKGIQPTVPLPKPPTNPFAFQAAPRPMDKFMRLKSTQGSTDGEELGLGMRVTDLDGEEKGFGALPDKGLGGFDGEQKGEEDLGTQGEKGLDDFDGEQKGEGTQREKGLNDFDSGSGSGYTTPRPTTISPATPLPSQGGPPTPEVVPQSKAARMLGAFLIQGEDGPGVVQAAQELLSHPNVAFRLTFCCDHF